MVQPIVTPEQVNFLIVFLEGVLSFFSPCVLPLLPVYISYLAGGAKQVSEDGQTSYRQGRVFLHTLCFILGISAAFFLLGLSFTALGGFFSAYRLWFTRIGGILIVLMGLFQLGLFELPFLQRERKFHLPLNPDKMNPLWAVLLGFTFSFAWTPCVGPALSSVLILASSAETALTGNLLVLVYALGFVLPFLLLGLFTTQTLNFLKKRQKVLKYTIKIGGALLVLIGIMTFTGWMNGVSSYLNRYTGTETSSEASSSEPESSSSEPESSSEEDAIPAPDFSLVDQYGETHTLSDYQGKVVFLNFWTTWCTYCKQEMPDIDRLYEEYGKNQEEVVFLGVANPRTEENPQASDVPQEEIQAFLKDKGYQFPTVFDLTGEVYAGYGLRSFPTTFVIDREGNLLGYQPGMMSKEIMRQVIEMALELSPEE